LPIISSKPDFGERSKFKTTPKTTFKVADLLKVDTKKDQQQENAEIKTVADEPFSPEQLQATWNIFAEQRKSFPAEYQLLSQSYVLQDKKIIVQLLHPVQETMLNNMKSEIIAFLRERLKNNSITLYCEVAAVDETKKMIYTTREKLEFLMEKNPLLKELKDRFDLDPDL